MRLNQIIDRLGDLLSFLLLIMVGVGFLVVLLRYFFQMGWVWMQEIVSYSHAILFLGTLGYALLHEEHVRVDLFYSKLPNKKKNLINLLGHLFFLIPFCLFMIYVSFPYVKDSWAVWEGSSSGGGLEAVFLLKSFLIIGPLLLMFASFVQIYRSIQTRKTEN